MGMQDNQAWIKMFQRIPGNLHEVLAVVMTSGNEILIQKILKLEPDFMVLRGRLAGTQDYRVMLLPYGQMTVITITRMLKEAEVEAIFGKEGPAVVADMPKSPPAAEEPKPETPKPASEPPAPPDPQRKLQTSKSALVAKLRERLRDAK